MGELSVYTKHAMPKDISIKELRTRLAEIADLVEDGESFRVIRRSKPAFLIVQIHSGAEDEWETIIDFTDGGRERGVPVEDALKALRKTNR
jgi:antitoxin (DNA-binding transcriptional repressor) of toxin-antitoxin stability system